MMESKKFSIDSFDKTKNYSISASAGTGKTHNMVNIVYKLVNGAGCEPIPIEKMLIVTYTEKAAGELKVKINKRFDSKIDLTKAHIGTIHSFCQDTIKEFYQIMGLPSKLVVVDDSKMLDSYDRFIREQIYKGNLDVKDLNGKNYNYIKDCISKLYLNKSEEIDQDIVNFDGFNDFVYFLEDFNNNLLNLKDAKEDEILDYFNNCYNKDDVSLKDEIKIFYERLQEEFDFLINNNFSSEIESNEEEQEKLNEKSKNLTKEKKKVSPSRKLEIEKEQNDINELKKQITEKNNLLKKKKVDYEKISYQLIKNVQDGEFKLDRKINAINDFTLISRIIYNYKELLFSLKYSRLAVEFYKEWQEEKRSKKWITFNDMLREVREGVLNNETLVKKLREKYEYALIDEFQDTNKIQWDIFKKIFLESSNNHITVVGDKKQSIYSFQGADVNCYIDAVDEIVNSKNGDETYLPDNYRSTASLVTGYNKLFHMNSFSTLSYQDVGIGNKDIEIKYIDDDGKEENISSFGIVGKQDESSEFSFVTPYEYAKKCVELIIDFCSKVKGTNKTHLQLIDKRKESNDDGTAYNCSFKDFMVLVKTRSEYEYFEYELKKAGIPYVKYKDDSLFSGTECAQWIALINAILKPDFTGANRKAFRKALFTDFFGRSIDEIASPYFDRDDNPEMELIKKWRCLNKEFKHNELINSIIEDSDLEENLGGLTKIQSLNIFKQLGDYALNFLLEGNSLYALKNNLSRLSDGNNDLDDDSEAGSIVAKGTDFDCVQLMTMHASKGLDSPVVFIPGGFKNKNNNTSPIGIYHDKNKKSLITFNKDNYEEEESEEINRLFYVAYTRASHLMVIPYYSPIDYIKATSAVEEFVKNEENNSLYSKYIYENKPISRKKVQEIIGKRIDPGDKQEQLTEIKKIRNTVFSHSMFKHSYSSMSKMGESSLQTEELSRPDKEGTESNENLSSFDKSGIQLKVPYSDEPPITIPVDFPKGASIGTTLHEIFELFKFEDVNNESNNLEEIIKERFKANKIKLDDKSLEYVKSIVKNVLNANLIEVCGNKATSNSYKLCDVLSKDRIAEAEFNFNAKSYVLNYCNGFFDLIFKRNINGIDYYSILDWKSDSINDNDLKSYNNPEDVKKRVDAHYSIQRVLYSYCLIKWLTGLNVEENEEEVFNKHFGGIYYVFIRGCLENKYNGIYTQTWSSWTDLENEFENIKKNCFSKK